MGIVINDGKNYMADIAAITEKEKRPYKLKPDGTPQYHRVWKRRSNRWDVIPVKEGKQYKYISELLLLTLNYRAQHALPLRSVKGRKRFGSSITPEAPPETATIAASKRSRFGSS